MNNDHLATTQPRERSRGLRPCDPTACADAQFAETNIGWWLLALVLLPAVSAYSLSDYPNFFIHDSKFDPFYVVGTESPSLDVVSATLISTSIARYNLTPAVGTSRVDTDIPDITKYDAIVIGDPCVNRAAAQLEGKPEPCDAKLEGSRGYLKLFEHGDKVQILITGLTEEDRHAAAKHLAEKDLSEADGKVKTVQSFSGSIPGMISLRLREKAEAKLKEVEEKAKLEKPEPVEEVRPLPQSQPVIEPPKEDPVAKTLEEIKAKREARQQRGWFARFFAGIWLFLRSLFW